METWQIKIIKDNCSKLKQEEKRKHVIAYAELDKKHHGYLSSISFSEQVWYQVIPADDLKELKKTYSLLFNNPKARKPGLYMKTDLPFLSLDGVYAVANDMHKGHRLDIQCIMFPEMKVAKAIVTSELHGIKEAYANIDDENYEDAASSATRKALSLMGIGRFPRHTTQFGSDNTVAEFIKFKKEQAKK